MIEKEKNDYGWEFLFLGANIDAVGEAAKFGIEAKRAVNYRNDSVGTLTNYEVLSIAMSCTRKAKSKKEIDAILEKARQEIAQDYMNRE